MYGVALHTFCFLSNHFHLLGTVSSAEQMSLFTGFLKGNLAKEIGRLRDWRETFWGRRYHSASVKETEQDQVRRFLYILDNGCKEGLVASPLEWPGVSSAPALYRGRNNDARHLVRPYRAVSRPTARRKQALPFHRDRPFDPASVPPRTKRRRTTSVLRRSGPRTRAENRSNAPRKRHDSYGGSSHSMPETSRQTEGVQSLPRADYPRREPGGLLGDVQRAQGQGCRLSRRCQTFEAR